MNKKIWIGGLIAALGLTFVLDIFTQTTGIPLSSINNDINVTTENYSEGFDLSSRRLRVVVDYDLEHLQELRNRCEILNNRNNIPSWLY